MPLRSMTGFGRCQLDDADMVQTWEIRSVNSRFLDLKWKLPPQARNMEARFEKVVRRFASRGRVEISLNLQRQSVARASFDADQANAMLDAIKAFASSRGDIFNITCIDDSAKMRPLYEQMKDRYQCLWFTDMYSGERWFEILPPRATKANAIARLKELLGCDRVVCFGDAENDISMFGIADECYAMANAVDELKAIATDVIGSHEEDGVARFLLTHYHRNGEKKDEM